MFPDIYCRLEEWIFSYISIFFGNKILIIAHWQRLRRRVSYIGFIYSKGLRMLHNDHSIISNQLSLTTQGQFRCLALRLEPSILSWPLNYRCRWERKSMEVLEDDDCGNCVMVWTGGWVVWPKAQRGLVAPFSISVWVRFSSYYHFATVGAGPLKIAAQLPCYSGVWQGAGGLSHFRMILFLPVN